MALFQPIIKNYTGDGIKKPVIKPVQIIICVNPFFHQKDATGIKTGL